MKRAILPALGLALLLAIPAVSQDKNADLEELQAQVEELQAQAKRQQQRIEALEAWSSSTRSQASTLLKKLKFAEKKGYYYPAPHVDARKSLLFGLQDFASVASGGKAGDRSTDDSTEEK